MTIVMGPRGALRDAIVHALGTDGATVLDLDHDDPFGAALGHSAVVYLPSSELGDGAAPPDVARLRGALRAARAPDVETFVAVLPARAYEAELAAIKREGVPYVVLRAPASLEELGDALDPGVMLVPRDAALSAISARELAEAVRDALATDRHGRVVDLTPAPRPAAEVLERAAAAVGRAVRVLSLWRPLVRAVAWLARALGLRAPTFDRLALPAARAS